MRYAFRLKARILVDISFALQTLNSLRSQTAWRTILTSILELGAQRIVKLREDSLKAPSDSTADNGVPQAASDGPPRVWPLPNASKTLDRPYATVSGRRHVPKLVNANRVAFLRLKKPQSPFLSRIIRDTIETRERRIALSVKLAEQVPIAQKEDEWDDILYNEFGLKNDGYERAWSHEIRKACIENHRLQVIAIQRRSDIAARLHSIAEKEKGLAAEEKRTRQNEKHKRVKIRRLARRGQTIPVAEQSTIMGAIKDLPNENITEMSVHDKEKFKTWEEIEKIKVDYAIFRTEEEVADIKAARVRRKEEKAKKKAEKATRKAESLRFWQEKLDQQPTVSMVAANGDQPPALPTQSQKMIKARTRASPGRHYYPRDASGTLLPGTASILE